MTGTLDITGLAVALLAALLAGMGMSRLRQPPFVGYLVVGMVLGPGGIAVTTADQSVTVALVELFVMVLLFATALELGVRARSDSWRTAGAVVGGLIVAGLIVVFPLALLVGRPVPTALLLGFIVALSGIAPTLAMATRSNSTTGRTGHMITTVLVAQALAFLPMALVLKDLGKGEDGFGFTTLFLGVLAAGLVAAGVVQFARRPRIALPLGGFLEAGTASALFAALVYCFAGAALLGLAGLPPAYGALLAGLAVGNSRARRRVLAAIRPVRGILGLAFFLFLGLLTDLGFVWDNLGAVVLLLLTITAVRVVLAVAVVQRMGGSWQHACLAGTLMAPLGELAVALTVVALAAGAVAAAGAKLAFAVVAFSLLLCPLWLVVTGRVRSAGGVPVESLGELFDTTFGADAAQIREKWGRAQRGAGAPPAASTAHADPPAASAAQASPPAASATQASPAHASPAAQESGGATGRTTSRDPFTEIGNQVRDAARNDDGPAKDQDTGPAKDQDTGPAKGEDGGPAKDEDAVAETPDEDGYRPPRPDA